MFCRHYKLRVCGPCVVKSKSWRLTFSKTSSSPCAWRLTFRELGDSAECKIYARAGKIDLIPPSSTKIIRHTQKRPDSGHPLPVQSTATVQSLDALIPSRATQASRAGHFRKNRQHTQLHSLLHIKVLWLVTRIKQA